MLPSNLLRFAVWTLVCLIFHIPGHVVARSKSRSKSGGATPFPPPSDDGLFTVVQNLVQQVGELKATQARDWSRIRRTERRGKSVRNDLDVMHADVVQLKQYVTEINTNLARLNDMTSDLQLEVTGLTSGQQKMHNEVRKLKLADRDLDSKVTAVHGNITRMDAETESVKTRLGDVVKSVQSMQNQQKTAMDVLTKFDRRLRGLVSKSPSGSATKGQQVLTGKTGTENVLQKPQRDQIRVSAVDGELSDEDGLFNETAVYSGDGDSSLTLDGGSGDEEFIIVEEHVTEAGSGDGDVIPDVDSTVSGAIPTPLTTYPVPTLTQASVTAPTTPTSPCPSAADISRLHQRIDNIETRFNASVPPDDALLTMTNEMSRLSSELTKRDETLGQLQEDYEELGAVVSRLSDQMASLRLRDFMERLQRSLVNFTSNVLTLDQWQTASQQMVSATQRTEDRLSNLANRVLDNSKLASDLQFSVRDYQLLGERQYRVLQTHIIRLNNTLQDLEETVNQLGNKQASLGSYRSHKPSRGAGGNSELLSSRVDDIALQIVYSDNRLSHLETRLLNASLDACKKTNNDLYQDASIQQMDQQMSDARRDIAILQETVKRLDLNIYRLHGNTKATQEVLRKVQGQVRSVDGVTTSVRQLKKEVDNLLFQMPRDCDDYYSRGYRRSGDYIIYPRNADHSVKVRCNMYTKDSSSSNNRRKKNRDDRKKKNDYNVGDDDDDITTGGWTVIQQRNSGRVNFTRSWAEYAVGFGATHSEYWLGNEFIHLMTSQRNYSLLITMRDIFGGHWLATYSVFALNGKEDNYRLTLNGYRGNATDTFNYSAGMTFSTYDRDTDLSSSPCARYNGGGWWYSHCQISNLNGPYDVGMIWFHRAWKDWLQLREVVMMIKPRT